MWGGCPVLQANIKPGIGRWNDCGGSNGVRMSAVFQVLGSRQTAVVAPVALLFHQRVSGGSRPEVMLIWPDRALAMSSGER